MVCVEERDLESSFVFDRVEIQISPILKKGLYSGASSSVVDSGFSESLDEAVSALGRKLAEQETQNFFLQIAKPRVGRCPQFKQGEDSVARVVVIQASTQTQNINFTIVAADILMEKGEAEASSCSVVIVATLSGSG